MRLDPFSARPQPTDADVAARGVYDLTNCGIIDSFVDLGVTLARVHNLGFRVWGL